jgi:hypothetical protein
MGKEKEWQPIWNTSKCARQIAKIAKDDKIVVENQRLVRTAEAIKNSR